MVPPDGMRARRLPTLSWDSIVDDADTPAPEAGEAPANPSDAAAFDTVVPDAPPAPPVPPVDPSPLRAPSSLVEAPARDPEPIQPITLGPLPGSTPDAPLAATVPPPSNDAAAGPASVDTDISLPTFTAPSIAMLGSVDTGPADVAEAPAADTPDVVSTELPQIREATPPPHLDESELKSAEPDDGDVDGGSADTGSATSFPVPRIPQPDQSQIRPPAVESPLAVATPTGPPPQKRRRRRSGLKLVVTLVVLGGLVAAGVVFGGPYLFPDDWDGAAKPYADTVVEVSGVEYAEPLTVVAEPTDAYSDRMIAQVAGDWTAQLPEWRALGLVNGGDVEQVTNDLLAGWEDALYSLDDGQVYHDDAASGAQLDAQLTLAMAMASLDQTYGWSTEQSSRSLDDAAQTSAEVLRQARAIQTESDHSDAIEPRPAAPLAYVPPIVGYQVLAPTAFAEFANPQIADGDASANALQRLGAAGPGPLDEPTPDQATDPVVFQGDQIVTSAAAQDRSFWYLVLAGQLDGTTAYAASEAIVENSMTVVEREGTRCVYGTFSGGNVDQTATLRGALEAWAAKVPVEMASSFGVLADGSLQLVSCDPGAGFENGARLGVAHELIGWRMAELAAVELAAENLGEGSTEAELTTAANFARDQVRASGAGTGLGGRLLDSTPAQAADGARAAVAATFVPGT